MCLGSNHTRVKQLGGTTRHWDTIKAADTTQEAEKITDEDKEAVKVEKADKDVDAGAKKRRHLSRIMLRAQSMPLDVALFYTWWNTNGR